MNRQSKGFTAAGLGMSCCVLPLVLIALGLGGSLLTVFLVKYKAYFMTMAMGILVYSWMQYARDARECATQFCEIAGGSIRKWILGVNTVVVIFFLIITYTPAGALVGIDFQGEPVATVQATGQRATAGLLPPLLAAPPVYSKTSQTQSARVVDGVTRLERLSLRVEGMS